MVAAMGSTNEELPGHLMVRQRLRTKLGLPMLERYRRMKTCRSLLKGKEFQNFRLKSR